MAAFKLSSLFFFFVSLGLLSDVAVSDSRHECAVIRALQDDVEMTNTSNSSLWHSNSLVSAQLEHPHLLHHLWVQLLMQLQPRELISPSAGLNVTRKSGNLT